MSHTITYRCDKCAHEQHDHDQFWALSVSIHPWASSGETSTSIKKMDLCRRCVEDLGMLPPAYDRKPPAPPAPPSIEDIVRDIVREEIPWTHQQRKGPCR